MNLKLDGSINQNSSILSAHIESFTAPLRKDGTPFKFRHTSQYSQVPLFWPAQWSLGSGCSCHT
ncbi:hypothetical protein GYMLUDRAFT_927210 [Collybiopsis luxurians FD-317 M1]|uniref:Uncharacterized protein n=1 Tax=Collybiopsis luxurians FD-317 M1 TaxID=944289 RepID=A0A0D0BVC2_9AGAR|nr:hypothetical protein GYMLUDRAFT_927210 [Collybiopsis luxurians FD-317 M1]